MREYRRSYLLPALALVLASGLTLPLAGWAQTVDVEAPTAVSTPPASTIAAPSTDSTPDPIAAALAELQQILTRYELALPAEEAVREAVVAVARVADPGAELLESSDVSRLEKLERGILYATGLHITRSNATTLVTRVEPDSPAGQAGIQSDDVIVGIDGENASSLNIAELTERLRGLESSTIALKLRTGDEPVRDAEVTTAERQLESVAEIREFPAQLGYIRLNGLFPAAGAAVVTELLSMRDRNLAGAIIDIRGADGRDIRSVVEIAEMVAPDRARLFSFRDARDQDLEVHHAGTGKPLGIPMMILIDGKTTGSAELLAAAVHGSGRGAMLLGEPTAGDPLVRDRVMLNNGLLLYLATRRLVVGEREIYTGRNPIVPDIRIDPNLVYPDYVPEAPVLTDRRGTTDNEVAARRLRQEVRGDIALTRAADVILGLKALNINGFGDDDDSSR